MKPSTSYSFAAKEWNLVLEENQPKAPIAKLWSDNFIRPKGWSDGFPNPDLKKPDWCIKPVDYKS